MAMDLVTIIFVLIAVVIGYFIGNYVAKLRRDKHWEGQIDFHRQDAISRSRAVLAGHFSEQLAPYLPDFPFKPNECKFLGKPVDFIVFHGLDDKNVTGVSFVEVKSGKSRLSGTEKSVKEAIENKNVYWEEYRVPDDLK